jgi:digeranylgeranylglycerophospholipid reductase
MEYDVVIVGAGPAGSITAKFTAMKGIRTVIVDKRAEVGVPVRCGEGISKGWLESVGITYDRKWVANEVDGARIISPDGTAFVIDERLAGNEVGLIIERDIFDRELAKDAIKAGADLILRTTAVGLLKEGSKVTGVKVMSLNGATSINAKIIVGADGYESQVGRWAGIDTSLTVDDIDVCLEYQLTDISCDKRYSDFYLGSCAPGGYAWVFPKSDDTANVGIGVQLAKIRRKGELKWYLDKFIKNHNELAKGKPLKIIAGAVSTCAPITNSVKDNVLLVGDAARMIDPLTGGGIANACRAGKLAGETISETLEANDYSLLQKYDKGWRDLFEHQLYRDWLAKQKFVTLSDDTFNKLINAVVEVGVEKLTVYNLLKVVQLKCPELVEEFEDFL